SAACSTIGASVPSMSNMTAVRLGWARRGASASDRSAEVTDLVCPLSFVRACRATLWQIPCTPRMSNTTQGDGYAVSDLDAMGAGYGFRKVRRELEVTAFGINAIVLPPGYSTGVHYHDEQEETYFVHRGDVEFRFGDGSTHVLGAGGLCRVDAATHRGMRNVGTGDAIIVIAGS